MHSKDLSLVRIKPFIITLFIILFPQLSACVHATDALLYPLHWYDSNKCSLPVLLLDIINVGNTYFAPSCHPA